jgi:hypothetical protein
MYVNNGHRLVSADLTLGRERGNLSVWARRNIKNWQS